MKIGYVEDEKDFANLVLKYFKYEDNYQIDCYDTGEKAMSHIQDGYDLWILDIMLPGVVDGYKILEKIREFYPNVPVIFVSSLTNPRERLRGLTMGSDDYVGKENVPELVLRVKKLLGRAYPQKNSINNKVEYNGYLIDLDKRVVSEKEEIISLTAKEYDLLVFLLENKGKAFSRDQILDSVWGPEYFGSDRVVDDLMRRLRSKLDKISVETIYGYGYRLI